MTSEQFGKLHWRVVYRFPFLTGACCATSSGTMAGSEQPTAWTPRFIAKFLISTAGVYGTFLLWGVCAPFRSAHTAASENLLCPCAFKPLLLLRWKGAKPKTDNGLACVGPTRYVRFLRSPLLGCPCQILQERLTAEGFKDASGRKHTFPVAVLNLVQSLGAALVGAIGIAAFGLNREAPLSKFFVVGLSTTIASPFGCA